MFGQKVPNVRAESTQMWAEVSLMWAEVSLMRAEVSLRRAEVPTNSPRSREQGWVLYSSGYLGAVYSAGYMPPGTPQ